MQTVFRLRFAHWLAARPPPQTTPSTAGTLCHAAYPLRPLVGQFHRLLTLLLMLMAAILLILWLVMRVLYPQSPAHIDDFTDYEALLPNRTADPEQFGLRILTHSVPPEDVNLDRAHTYRFINTTQTLEVVIVEIPYNQGQIVRLTLYSHKLHLLDLLWRWGRPSLKQRDISAAHWDYAWLGDGYTVLADVRYLRLDSSVSMVEINIVREEMSVR